jgi:serine/threonine-protein kinase PpkA
MDDVPAIPGYRIEKKLGEGGMAAVFLGVQDKLYRKVAIKILDPFMLKHRVFEMRFLHEAETASNMSHPNIISIYDIGRFGDYCYMVMEYLSGSLKERLLSSPGFKLKPELAGDILKPIAGALGYAHGRGIIHRDIKPDNIMFRKDGTPVLTDFGIARALDSDIRMTRSGVSVGTPYYMSPEQCKAEQLDGRSDIYSLGVVLFEILTGKKPYEADNPMAVALKHIREPVPQLPIELRHYQPLIDKMMAKRKEDRAASCEELLERIDYVFQQASEATVFFTAIRDTEPGPINPSPSAPPFEAEQVTRVAVKAVRAPGPPPESLPESLDELEFTPLPPPEIEPAPQSPPSFEPAPVIVSESVPSVTQKSVPLPGKYPVKKLKDLIKRVLLRMSIKSNSSQVKPGDG